MCVFKYLSNFHCCMLPPDYKICGNTRSCYKIYSQNGGLSEENATTIFCCYSTCKCEDMH